MSNLRVTYTTTTLLRVKYTKRFGRIQNMTRPTVKIKRATIVTKKAIHILIDTTRRRKRTTTTSPSPVNKVEPLLNNCPKL